ncbi:MAG: TonB-dependent siderophore receptor, partial [Litorimonas sp.]
SLLFGTILSATASSAQAEDLLDSLPLDDEIVVTGQYLYTDQINALRSPTPIIDVPQSLSIITAEEIAVRGFTSVGQIIDYTPGVNTSQGEGHRDAVVFRGVRSTADFFIDGVRDDVQYYRPLYNLEQVEILRGPNALLFGRGGTGGLINRVTKKGRFDERFTGYQASVDTFGAFDLQLDGNYSVSDTAAFRLNALYEQLDNHRDFYDGERIGLNPTARFQIGDDTLVDLSYEFADHERFIDRGIPTDDAGTGRPVEALRDIVFADPEHNETRLEAHILRATVTQQVSDTFKGVFSASYADYDKFYENFYASDYILATNSVQLDGYVDTTQRQTLNLSANIVGEFSTGRVGHTVVAGVEYIDTSNDNDRFNPVFSSTGNDRERFVAQRPLDFRGFAGVNFDGVAVTTGFTDVNDITQADIEVASAYVQNEIALSDHLDIVLGARFDRFELSVDDLVGGTTRTRTDEEVSPRAGIVFKPRESVSVYGSFSRSFLPRSGEQFASLSASTEALSPDVFENLEAGVKWDVLPGLNFTAALFQNEQTVAARDDANPEEFEIRGLEVQGVELQLQGQLTDALFVTAGYSYLDGETDNGLEAPRELPENMASAWARYQVSDRLGLGLGVTYQDESFLTDRDFDKVGAHPTLPAYTRFDAAAYYDVSEDLRLQVNVENLTDTLYFPNSHSTHQATVGRPLNARFTISGRF